MIICWEDVGLFANLKMLLINMNLSTLMNTRSNFTFTFYFWTTIFKDYNNILCLFLGTVVLIPEKL